MKPKVLMYRRFERFWHWAQAVLVLALLLTGFEIRGTWTVLGFADAVVWHDRLFWILLGLFISAIFWHFTTGEWRQYIPTRKNLVATVWYYLRGIFRGQAHPGQKTAKAKLNPLQRLTYLGLMLAVFPLQVISGFLYYYHSELREAGVSVDLGFIAGVHTFGAYLLLAFFILHVYLTTTGNTLFSNLWAMITGWEEVEVEDEHVVATETH